MACILCNEPDKVKIIEKNSWNLVRCLNCGLLYIDPQPSKEQLARLYSQEENYHTQCLGEITDSTRWENIRNNRLAKLVGSPPNTVAHLLDIGCSTGLFLIRARELNWHVQGIEISTHTAEFARQAYNLDIHLGGAENILNEFGSQSYDAVTLWDFIEHMQNPIDILHKVFQILKPGGRLYLATPNADGWVARYHLSTLVRWWNYWPHPEPPYHLYQFTPITIQQAIRKAGFTIIALYNDEIPLWYTSGYKVEPNIKGWFQDPVYIPHGRLVYLFSWPVHRLARLLRRGDSVIVKANKPLE